MMKITATVKTVDHNVQQQVHSRIMGRNVNTLPLLKSVGHLLKKLNICLSSNRAIPREMKIYVHTKTCKHMFIAALFIINKN